MLQNRNPFQQNYSSHLISKHIHIRTARTQLEMEKKIYTWRKRSVRCKQRLIVISGARCNEGKAVISLFDKRTEVLISAGWKNSGKGK